MNDGSLFTLGRLLDEYVTVDFKPVRAFPIPVVMFMGRHDYTTPSQPTADWLERVDAPYKRGVWFERSAHMMPWEEPGKLLVSLLSTCVRWRRVTARRWLSSLLPLHAGEGAKADEVRAQRACSLLPCTKTKPDLARASRTSPQAGEGLHLSRQASPVRRMP